MELARAIIAHLLRSPLPDFRAPDTQEGQRAPKNKIHFRDARKNTNSPQVEACEELLRVPLRELFRRVARKSADRLEIYWTTPTLCMPARNDMLAPTLCGTHHSFRIHTCSLVMACLPIRSIITGPTCVAT